MPGLAAIFNDRQLADLAAYVRNHFTKKPEWQDRLNEAGSVREEGEPSALSGGG